MTLCCDTEGSDAQHKAQHGRVGFCTVCTASQGLPRPLRHEATHTFHSHFFGGGLPLLQTGQVTVGQPAASSSRWARVPHVGQGSDLRSLGWPSTAKPPSLVVFVPGSRYSTDAASASFAQAITAFQVKLVMVQKVGQGKDLQGLCPQP